jgi:Tannase and feruloyl esterase
MTARALAGTLIAVSALVLSGSAQAQNSYSFLDAAKSPINYSVANAKPQMKCADLRALSTPDTTIIDAKLIPAADDVPEHCRVSGNILPEVNFEVNLPSSWNRRFYMNGNGGYAGERPDQPNRAALRANALRNGFTSATTNTGHDAIREPLGTFTVDRAKLIDYAFRAVHLTAVTAKRIAARYYGRPPAFSYWDGCSTGGRQGLMEAQRFPGDFDGIVAGAPVLNLVDTMVVGVWNARALEKAPITMDKLKVVETALYNKCDKRDGLADGVIDDPRRCDFDPARDAPKCAAGQDGPDCLTDGQAASVAAIYGGVRSNGAPFFFGYTPGAEKVGINAAGGAPVRGWDRWIITSDGAQPLQLAFAETFLRYAGFGIKSDPTYDARTFDFDKDPPRLEEMRALINANNPDLAGFRSRGGKLMMYHGWADTALTPLMGVDYYERAVQANGPDTGNFFRLFMVPGMFHCRGGVGVDRLDALTALINWVEGGKVPDTILATRVEDNKVTRTRPLCPYPQVARYSGNGSSDEAASFACQPPD